MMRTGISSSMTSGAYQAEMARLATTAPCAASEIEPETTAWRVESGSRIPRGGRASRLAAGAAASAKAGPKER